MIFNNFKTYLQAEECPAAPTDPTMVTDWLKKVIVLIEKDIQVCGDLKKTDKEHGCMYAEIEKHFIQLKKDKEACQKKFEGDKDIKSAWATICKLIEKINKELEDAHKLKGSKEKC